MIEKTKAVRRLLSEYTDQYSRVTLNPARDSNPETGDYDSENQGLWTGEAGILLHLNGFHEIVSGPYKRNFNKMMTSIEVDRIPGLYSRHPYPFYKKDHHNVSKDEYRGFAYGAAVTQNKGLMRKIIEYGQINDWFFIDDDPYERGDFDHLGAYRLPSDRGLYKIVAGQEPSVIERLFIGISALIASRKPRGNTSSKLMGWFTFKAIEISGYESKILNYFKRKVDKNLKMCYNSDNYIEEIAKIYFQADHPFHELFKGLK